MWKITCLVALFILQFFLNSTIVFGSAPTINSHPDSVSLENSFTVQVSMDGLSDNTIYRLRLVLAPVGTSNYFGSTYNGTEWYNGTPSPINYSKFLSISTDQNGEWSGEVSGKIEADDPNYNNIGTNTYDLKIGRYTQSGTSATWSNIVAITLLAPTLTPTPTNTPTPTDAPTPTKVPTPTRTPTPIKTPTLTPTKTPTSTPNPLRPSVTKTQAKTPTQIPTSKITSNDAMPTSVLGAEISAKPTPKSEVLTDSAQSNNTFKVFAIIVGSLCILGSIIYFFLKTKGNNSM